MYYSQLNNENMYSGGSYGGKGGLVNSNSNHVHLGSYGLLKRPLHEGSGGASNNITSANSGAGAGVIVVAATLNITVNGVLAANGA